MKLFFTVVFLAVLLQRLVELRVAKKNGEYIRSLGGYEVGADHYPYIVAMHTLFLLSLLIEVVMSDSALPSFWWLPFSLFLLAQAGRYWCLYSLGRFWNTRIYVLPKASLVNCGPYRYLRHPNYVIVGIELFALPFTFSAYITALLFSICNLWILMRIRIPLEEKTLDENAEEESP